MKKYTTMKQWLAAAAVGLALAVSSNTTWAQGTNTTFTFDDESSIASFTSWWGVSTTFSWDGSMDAGGDSNSGSVLYDVPFTGTSGDQFMTFFTIANRWQWDGGTTVDASAYTNLSFQIYVDPSSGKRKDNNDYGYLDVGIVYGTNWGSSSVGGAVIPASASGNWVEMSFPVSSSVVGLDQVVGFYLKMWSDGAMPSELIFHVDDFKLTKPGIVVIPNPTVKISKAYSGLQLTTTATSGQYGRQSVHTVGDNYSWVDQGQPVSYSVQIKNAPDARASGFQTHLFFVPTASAPYGSGDSAVDWNAPNVVWLNIQALGAQLRYKTNQASGNTMLFNSNPTNGPVGAIASLDCPSPVGTWTLTFNNNTSITLTAPNGATTNVSISADAPALFANPLFIDIGVQPNDSANIGLSTTVTRFWTTNTATPLDYTFTGSSLDTENWGTSASDSSGIIMVPEGSSYWFSWTLPASMDAYAMASSTITGKWTDLSLSNPIQVGSSRQALVPESSLPSKSATFFALGKRTFTKLLVLLPGETIAPGTATGKTGTPDEVFLGVDIAVTVYAVDDNWNIVKSVTDTINLSSTDLSANLPADAAMTGGKVTFTATCNNQGTYTFTASDVTDSSKKSGTSTSMTFN
jgi:hypothetical protein